MARDLLHSSQLGERLRHGDAKARPRDKTFKVLLNLLVLGAFILLMLAVVGQIGIGPATSLAMQTYLVGTAALMLAGSCYLHQAIRWRALRGSRGKKVLDKARADIELTIVSFFALSTVIAIILYEIGAMLVFLGLMPITPTVIALANNSVLVQVITLLVYILAVVMRELHPTTFEPSGRSRIIASIFGPIAVFLVLFGIIMATGGPQRIGFWPGLLPRQAGHLVTLGVALEFVAMRIRLRLPSLWFLMQESLEAARRAQPEVKDALRRRAQRTYITAMVFVALSMGFAGAMGSGALTIQDSAVGVSLAIFYSGAAVIILGLVALRALQAPHLKESGEGQDELERLIKQRRRTTEEVFRIAIYVVCGAIAFAFVILAILTSTENLGIHKRYATDFTLLAIFFGAGPYGYFFNLDRKRIDAIDNKFPDFLRDIAESARAGMTLPRALVAASKGTYGTLTPEIERMAIQVEWGVDFGEAFQNFADRVKTPLINRTVTLVVEAQRAGGNVVDVLTAASEDAREIKQIITERNEQMSMYSVVIYIAYFVFIAVVLILSSQFIPAFRDAVSGAEGQQLGGIRFTAFDPEDYNTLFFHAAMAQAIGGGLVGGVMTRGHPMAGFNAIIIMLIMAWFSFRILVEWL